MHRRVDVAEGPFVGGQLAIGMHVALMEHQQQLVLGKVTVDQRHRNAMKGQVPRGVPGVLPGIGHEDDIIVAQMPPSLIAAALGRRRWPGRITPQPCIYIIVVELLAPEQPGQRLSLYRALILCFGCAHRTIKIVGFSNARGEYLRGTGKGVALPAGR